MSRNEILSCAAIQARGLAIDAVAACSSGHLGLPLGCAEIGAVLFGQNLVYNPKSPKWLNRDRFILSAGHGSMFVYSWLHLSGYDLPLQELKDFRKQGSLTPGHPEYDKTPGVEATTGPLGQGIGNAVGYALSGKRAAAKFNTPEYEIFNYHVVTLAGDGCLQEGVAREAISFAGHAQLDNLILIYDSNQVTLDAMAEVTQSEDSVSYFKALNWQVWEIDGHNLNAVRNALDEAKAADNGKPKIIIANTEIGQGIPEVAGTQKAHGEGGAKFAKASRQALGLPDETFYVSEEVRDYFKQHTINQQRIFESWQTTFAEWSQQNPQLNQELQDGISLHIPRGLLDKIKPWNPEKDEATRNVGGKVLNQVAELVPNLLSGSADLFGSTKNYLDGKGDFSAENLLGRNIWYGIREHAMGAILNGIAYDGFFRASGATFLVFADYMRPSIRLAALSRLPVIYVFTHDSVGVGEDGPTHQPVETVSGLRLIPGLQVIRPGDAEEVAGAWSSALYRTDGPTALILSRQSLRTLSEFEVSVRRKGVFSGGYILKEETTPLELILMASGSELQHVVSIAERLGAGVRVVSMPSMEIFEQQTEVYREKVLPTSCQKRLAVEAGVTHLWYRYVGNQGKVLGIDRFGLSAPGDQVMTELGIDKEAVYREAKKLLD